MPQKAWNESDLARLKQLWEAGLSTSAIGKEMGISKNAVVGKAHRIGLPGKPSPIIRGKYRPPAHLWRPVKTLPPMPAPPPLPAIVEPPARPKPVLVERPKVVPIPPPAPKSRFRSCQFVDGHRGSFRFTCDDQPFGSSAYCERHHQLFHVRVRDRSEDEAA